MAITSAGVLQPLIVRMTAADGKHELLAGERRWRSAKIAGLKTVPVRIVDVTDEEACEIQARENFDREDLNPIERARQFQHLLDTLKITQDALAKRYDLSQGEISNSIRLLRLPEAAQRLVISGEITATEARDELVPFADIPDLIESAVKQKGGGELGYRVKQAAAKRSRRMDEHDWHDDRRLFKLTSEVRKQLDVRKIWGEERAFNIELYDRLQAEAKAVLDAKEAKREKSDAAAAKSETPAERKLKAKKQADQLVGRLDRWRTAWLQRRIAAILPKATDGVLFRLLLHFAVNRNSGGQRFRPDELKETLRAFGAPVSRDRWSFDSWKSLSPIATAKPRSIAIDVLAKWVQHDLERAQDFDDADIERLAKELGIDLQKEWRLDESFLQLHSTVQLRALVKEWDHAGLTARAEGTKTRGDLIKVILDFPDGVKCPKELAGIGKKRG